MSIAHTLAEVDTAGLIKDKDTLFFDYIDAFGQPCQGFIFRWKDKLYAYRNLCPHWSVVMDHDGSCFEPVGPRLMCYVHGARFDPTTGDCIAGPARGASLERFTIEPLDGTRVLISRRPRLF
jgi:nitrite reductase/ring-hydroxylating ferredoxin subunit